MKPGDNVPVLIWVYGGGNVLGFKELMVDPTRLIQSADYPMIYLSLNYRLAISQPLPHQNYLSRELIRDLL